MKLTKAAVELIARELFDGDIEVSIGVEEHSIIRTLNKYHLTGKRIVAKNLKAIQKMIKTMERDDTLLLKITI